jgi:nicotinamide/nicotinate riboside kinase
LFELSQTSSTANPAFLGLDSVPTITASSPEFGTREVQDWDCIDSVDLPLFEHTLKYLHEHGSLPPDSESKEDQNSVGETHVSAQEVQEWKAKAKSWLDGWTTKFSSGSDEQGGTKELRVYVVDGFLLYPPPPSTTAAATTKELTSSDYPHSQSGLDRLRELVQAHLRPKLFIPATRAQTLTRRAARSGYVTLEGFWTDPPGYVEDVVWPNYERYHAWMYEGGKVEGEKLDVKKCQDAGVEVCPGDGSWVMTKVLEWAAQRIESAIEERLK